METLEENKDTEKVVAQVTTNFFTTLEPLLANGMDLTLTFKRTVISGEAKMVVGVRPQHSGVTGKAGDKLNEGIRPLVLSKHNAAELDEAFFNTITQPMAEFDQAADAVKSFKASVDSAKDAAMDQKKKDAPKKASPPAKKKPAPAKKKVTPTPKPKAPAKPAAPKAEKAPKLTPLEKELKVVTDKQKHVESHIATWPVHTFLGEAKRGLAMAEKLSAQQVNKVVMTETFTALVAQAEKAVQDDKDAREKAKNDAKAKAAALKIEAQVKPILALAIQQKVGANFGDCGKNLKQVLKLDPTNAQGLALKAELVEKLGEATVLNLIK